MHPIQEMLLLAQLAEEEQVRKAHHDIATGGRAAMAVLPPEESEARFWAIMDAGLEVLS